MPNPSIERTRTGRPRYTASLLSVPRGLPVRAAHVKRWASKAPVLQYRMLKAKSSMPFKRSMNIRMDLERCGLVVEAKH